MEPSAKKTGYLQQDFRLFYNRDRQKRTFAAHYHDFHKLMILLGGNVTYCIEGRSYELLPGDVILVPEGLLHYPVIHDDSLYERIILYLSDAFLENGAGSGENLKGCFLRSLEEDRFLIRPEGEDARMLSSHAAGLIRAAEDTLKGAGVIRRCLTMELLVHLERMLDHESSGPLIAPSDANPAVTTILSFLNANLSNEDLCIDDVARAVSLDRSYLMHLFKEATGYTIGGYLTEKRLYTARTLLDRGVSVTEACYRSGFRNYSAFYYAWRKKYASSPQRGHGVRMQVEGE